MKKFILKLAAFALALLLPVGAYFGVIQSKPAVYAGSLMGSIREKSRLAEETPGARILLVGGSSVPYSIECKKVSEAFGMPCINLGATAYLGMELYLEVLYKNLHEGDIVIFAPEFSMYMEKFSYTTVWMGIENDMRMLKYIPLSYWPGMVRNFYNYATAKNGLLQAYGQPASPQQQYIDFGFGPWGDLTFERERLISDEYAEGDAIQVGADIISGNILSAMNKFYTFAQNKGAQVYLTWAPYCEKGVPTGQAGVQSFAGRIQQECDIPLISDYADCLWNIDYFYDSSSHLNDDGMRLRTQMLIEDMQKVLGS